MAKKIFFSALACLFIISGMGAENVVDYYLDMPSIYIVVCLTGSITFVIFPIRHIKYLCFHIWGKKDKIPESDYKIHREFYLFASNTALATGVAGQIIGMVAMLYNMSDPSSVGPSLAVSMICILYGVILSQFILLPLAKNIEIGSSLTSKNQSNKIGLLLSFLVPLLVASNFFILLLSVSHIHS